MILIGRAALVVGMAALLGACSTMGRPAATAQSTTSTTRPVAVATIQAPQAAPNLQGMDFTQAVAALAQTPGTGVVSVGAPSALALTAPATPRSNPAPSPARPSTAAPKAVAVVASPPVPLAPVVPDCTLRPLPPGCPATTVFGEDIAPVRRF